MKEFNILQNWWQFLLLAIVCYLVGCINFALIISRLKKGDITKMGSGNPGTMNMTREFGAKMGFLTFFGDAIKGGLPAVVTFFLYKGFVFTGTTVLVSDFVRYFCGLFVVLGHIFPVTMRFKGGKGIASTLGLLWMSLACENAWWLLICFTLLIGVLVFIFFTEWGSLGSLLGVTGLSIVQAVIFVIRYDNVAVNAYLVCLFMLIVAINILTWCAHSKNLYRLFSGEEHRTSFRKILKKKS